MGPFRFIFNVSFIVIISNHENVMFVFNISVGFWFRFNFQRNIR